MISTDLPKFKFSSLKEAKAEMLKFGITEKASTIGQARALLLLKRGELVRSAKQAKPVTDEATATVNTIGKPTIAPLATAKAAPVANPVAFDLGSYLGLRMQQLAGLYLQKSDLEILGVSNDAIFQIEAAIETLSKTTYREGVLLSNAYAALQQNELTKNIDPRELMADIQSSLAIKLKSEKAQKGLANWRSSSN